MRTERWLLFAVVDDDDQGYFSSDKSPLTHYSDVLQHYTIFLDFPAPFQNFFLPKKTKQAKPQD